MVLFKDSQDTRTITGRQDTESKDSLNSYLCDVRRFNLLTYAEETDLARQAGVGNELARHKLIESNLRLVIAIARHYTNSGASCRPHPGRESGADTCRREICLSAWL